MRTRTHLMLVVAFTTAALSGGASAQTNGTFLLTSTTVVSPATPSTTVEIWAAWDDPANQFQFGNTDYDITAGDGVFSDPVNVLGGPGSTAGVANGNAVSGGVNGMLWIPSLPPWGPPDNPILLATYTWTATDFTPRTVDLLTSNTTQFFVTNVTSGQRIALLPGQFSPGSGAITVVPTPAAWLVLCVPMSSAARRRRV